MAQSNSTTIPPRLRRGLRVAVKPAFKPADDSAKQAFFKMVGLRSTSLAERYSLLPAHKSAGSVFVICHAADILTLSFHYTSSLITSLTHTLRDASFAVPSPLRSTEPSKPIVRQACASQQEPPTRPLTLHAPGSAVGTLPASQVSQPSSFDLERWLPQPSLSLDAFVACLVSRSETELKVAYVCIHVLQIC